MNIKLEAAQLSTDLPLKSREVIVGREDMRGQIIPENRSVRKETVTNSINSLIL